MLKAARALAGLTSVELARLANIDASTISRMETSGARPVRGEAGSVDSVVRALEARGVVSRPTAFGCGSLDQMSKDDCAIAGHQ